MSNARTAEELAQEMLFPKEHLPVEGLSSDKLFTVKYGEVITLAQTALDAAVDAARAEGWQPIETAPTNIRVLVWIPNAEHYGDPIYRAIQVDMGTGRRWTVSGLSMGRDCGDRQPTYWRPLPAAPEAKEGVTCKLIDKSSTFPQTLKNPVNFYAPAQKGGE